MDSWLLCISLEIAPTFLNPEVKKTSERWLHKAWSPPGLYQSLICPNTIVVCHCLHIAFGPFLKTCAFSQGEETILGRGMYFSPALELVGAFLVLWAGGPDQLLSLFPNYYTCPSPAQPKVIGNQKSL